MKKTEKFNMVLTPEDKMILRRLARQERLSAAAVVRRLIWAAAQNAPKKKPATFERVPEG